MLRSRAMPTAVSRSCPTTSTPICDGWLWSSLWKSTVHRLDVADACRPRDARNPNGSDWHAWISPASHPDLTLSS